MEVRGLTVPGALEMVPRRMSDDRGVFLEWFRDDRFTEATGHRFDLQQANCSVSAAGVLRGIHYADVPPGQAKYVTCLAGAVLDVVVDLRVGSPAFGRWEAVLLDDVDRRAVYLPDGVGHAFLSLQDSSTVAYLCSTPYTPGAEHEVHPLDRDLGIAWPDRARDGAPLRLRLSPKDATAPGLHEARERGLLPTWAG